VESEVLWRVIMSWLPFIVIIGFWIFFMFQMKNNKTVLRQRQLVERSFEHMERVEVLLERIAVAVNRDR
jgi:ATP-dependent Zn protease